MLAMERFCISELNYRTGAVLSTTSDSEGAAKTQIFPENLGNLFRLSLPNLLSSLAARHAVCDSGSLSLRSGRSVGA